MPGSILAGVLLLRREPSGYLLGFAMLVFSWMVGITIAASTLAQVLAGYPYTTAQVAVLVAPFGVWLTIGFFRAASDPGAAPG